MVMGIGVTKKGQAVRKKPSSIHEAEVNVNRVMTIDEVAAYLQLGRRSVYRNKLRAPHAQTNSNEPNVRVEELLIP